MPPKKAAAKKKAVEAPPPPSEFDAMPIEQLKRILLEYRTDAERLARERSQAQVDRDAVERFFEITKKELRETELAVLAKEREMELAAENHRVEVKIYQQKVKHLEYEHTNAMKKLAGDDTSTLRTDDDLHLRREAALRAEKAALRSRLREMEDANAEAVRQMKLTHEKNLSKLRQEFKLTLETLRAKYEGRLQQLRDDLRLRHKVEIHEVEERKNLHINQLMKAHDDAFSEMKKYYNEITRANLELIADLKRKIAEANEKQAANQKLMMEIAEENKKLSTPLQHATAELESLQEDLRDADKDRQSLRYARLRLRTLRSQLSDMERQHTDLEARYADAEKERDELYAKFEQLVRVAQVRAEAKNEVLDKRLAEAETEYMAKKAQIHHVLAAAQLDPSVLHIINRRLDAVLETRNAMIRELQQSVALLTKSHNDAVRVFEAKLRDMGIPGEETKHALLPSATGVGPAGLVARPTIQ